MPGWLKHLLLALAGGALLVFAALALFVWWLDKNGARVQQQLRALEREGREFGQVHGKEACIDEGVRRGRACGVGLTCEGVTRSFASACFAGSPPDDEFCHRLPSGTGVVESSTAIVAACAKRGYPSSGRCGAVLRAAMDYCTDVD